MTSDFQEGKSQVTNPRFLDPSIILSFVTIYNL